MTRFPKVFSASNLGGQSAIPAAYSDKVFGVYRQVFRRYITHHGC